VAEVDAAPVIRGFSALESERILAGSVDRRQKMELELAQLSDEQAALKGTILTLAACDDSEKARDGKPHGAFTGALLGFLKDNGPKTYDELIFGVAAQLTGIQHPVRMPRKADAAFVSQVPFSI
jgi:hypothetical protein